MTTGGCSVCGKEGGGGQLQSRFDGRRSAHQLYQPIRRPRHARTLDPTQVRHCHWNRCLLLSAVARVQCGGSSLSKVASYLKCPNEPRDDHEPLRWRWVIAGCRRGGTAVVSWRMVLKLKDKWLLLSRAVLLLLDRLMGKNPQWTAPSPDSVQLGFPRQMIVC